MIVLVTSLFHIPQALYNHSELYINVYAQSLLPVLVETPTFARDILPPLPALQHIISRLREEGPTH